MEKARFFHLTGVLVHTVFYEMVGRRDKMVIRGCVANDHNGMLTLEENLEEIPATS
jgi:hypothetical protein